MQRTNGEVNARPVVTAAAIGTVIEWYDFALYGAASALVIGPLFSPNETSAVSILAAFATFAVGFFARPLGEFVVGHYGDKLGRKPALVFTVGLMGLSNVLTLERDESAPRGRGTLPRAGRRCATAARKVRGRRPRDFFDRSWLESGGRAIEDKPDDDRAEDGTAGSWRPLTGRRRTEEGRRA